MLISIPAQRFRQKSGMQHLACRGMPDQLRPIPLESFGLQHLQQRQSSDTKASSVPSVPNQSKKGTRVRDPYDPAVLQRAGRDWPRKGPQRLPLASNKRVRQSAQPANKLAALASTRQSFAALSASTAVPVQRMPRWIARVKVLVRSEEE